jgi:hypothetical protein
MRSIAVRAFIRLPRRRTRLLIVAALLVAGTGAYVGVRTLGQRTNRLRQRAQFHARRAAMFQKSVGSKERAAADCEAYGGERMLRIAAEYRAEVKLCVRLAEYHNRLLEKYERGAASPWLPIAADPPEPAP